MHVQSDCCNMKICTSCAKHEKSLKNTYGIENKPALGKDNAGMKYKNQCIIIVRVILL
jgi:hypothetical protein